MFGGNGCNQIGHNQWRNVVLLDLCGGNVPLTLDHCLPLEPDGCEEEARV